MPISYKRPHSVTRIRDLSDVQLDALLDLGGRVAVVTGGARGIGKACCARLAEAGATVVVADLDDAAARETAAVLGAPARRRAPRRADGASVAALPRRREAEHGRLDIWVNAAGISPPRRCSISPTTTGTSARHEPARHVRGCARGGARDDRRRARRRDRERLLDGRLPRGRARRRALRRVEVRRAGADESARRGTRAARDPRARGGADGDTDARLEEQREALRSSGFALEELGPTLPLGRVAVPDDVARVVSSRQRPGAADDGQHAARRRWRARSGALAGSGRRRQTRRRRRSPARSRRWRPDPGTTYVSPRR